MTRGVRVEDIDRHHERAKQRGARIRRRRHRLTGGLTWARPSTILPSSNDGRQRTAELERLIFSIHRSST